MELSRQGMNITYEEITLPPVAIDTSQNVAYGHVAGRYAIDYFIYTCFYMYAGISLIFLHCRIIIITMCYSYYIILCNCKVL